MPFLYPPPLCHFFLFLFLTLSFSRSVSFSPPPPSLSFSFSVVPWPGFVWRRMGWFQSLFRRWLFRWTEVVNISVVMLVQEPPKGGVRPETRLKVEWWWAPEGEHPWLEVEWFVLVKNGIEITSKVAVAMGTPPWLVVEDVTSSHVWPISDHSTHAPSRRPRQGSYAGIFWSKRQAERQEGKPERGGWQQGS